MKSKTKSCHNFKFQNSNVDIFIILGMPDILFHTDVVSLHIQYVPLPLPETSIWILLITSFYIHVFKDLSIRNLV